MIEREYKEGDIIIEEGDASDFAYQILSREHFAFYLNPQGICVVDLRSTLGTQVNGEFLGHDFSKDFVYLKKGENKISAGGIDSPFTFRAVVEEA